MANCKYCTTKDTLRWNTEFKKPFLVDEDNKRHVCKDGEVICQRCGEQGLYLRESGNTKILFKDKVKHNCTGREIDPRGGHRKLPGNKCRRCGKVGVYVGIIEGVQRYVNPNHTRHHCHY